MKLTFRELMDKLGVPHEITPYETYPFNVYDGGKGMTCSAEVRMGPDPHEIEAEVQMMFDSPPAGQPPMRQILWFSAKPLLANEWETKDARLNGEPIDRSIYNWEEKCCAFFGDLARFLKMEEIPDIDALIDEHFGGKERFYDQHGGGGGKSPKIKPAALMNIKKGGF
ncbi:MAG: hypothetical protein HYU57_02810 [Micavibrio aeruginosavorus]|nr:hypothetical protein [Micavibrio aeruginosavorus]